MLNFVLEFAFDGSQSQINQSKVIHLMKSWQTVRTQFRLCLSFLNNMDCYVTEIHFDMLMMENGTEIASR
jgi:hypothetical protein